MSEKTTKKKRNWFVNLIMEEDDSSTASESKEQKDKAPIDISVSNSGGALNTNGVIPITLPQTGNGTFDNNFNNMIQEVIANNNIDGIDYF